MFRQERAHTCARLAKEMSLRQTIAWLCIDKNSIASMCIETDVFAETTDINAIARPVHGVTRNDSS